MTQQQKSDMIEAVLTVACGVASFWVFWIVLDNRVERLCDFDCRWSGIFLP